MKKGKLIVIEGACDGIGKTTQFEILCTRLKKEGEDIVYHHFPTYHTYQGMPVEKYLQGEYGSPSDLSPYFVNSLYALDRAITWQTKLKQEYENGKIILLDRYTTSSLIYQSALMNNIEEKNKFIDYVTDFEYHKLEIQKPDCVIFLTAPFEVVTKIRENRKENDGIKNDIHERNFAFMKQVYDNAQYVANYLTWNKIICNDNQEMRSIKDIHEEVYRLVKRK